MFWFPQVLSESDSELMRHHRQEMCNRGVLLRLPFAVMREFVYRFERLGLCSFPACECVFQSGGIKDFENVMKC